MKHWWRAAVVAATTVAGCSGDGGAADPVLACAGDGAEGGAAGPRIVSVGIPAQAQGTVPMNVRVASGAGTTVNLSVELSRDGGATWHAARIAGGAAAVLAEGGTTTIHWDSVKDLGFHRPAQAKLRLRAASGAPACVVTTPMIDNLRAAARRVEHYMVNYGGWRDADVAMAKKYDLVIVHPQHADLDRARVAEIQQGVDASDPSDDVLVLGYVSVGEDMRTVGVSDDQARADLRFRGDGSGPRVDPRGAGAGGKPLSGIDPRGAPSNGGAGWASFYLDDNSLESSAAHKGDGVPDRNPLFGSYFVNAGDPAWFEVVSGMRMDGSDRLPGLREVLSGDYGRGLDCDGVFLDTIDTAAPNEFTTFGQSPNPTRFEWTAPGFSSFIQRVHRSYPDRLVLQNRGVFFFDPRHPHYTFTTRGSIDLVLFESFRLNSNKWEQWNPFFYADNRFNLAPKVMAEANRDDGFRVLSLGYAEGPGVTPDTLLGKSSAGVDTLLEDIRVTQDLTGMRHYLSNAMVDLVNTFVLDHDDATDTAPPVWTSSFNDHLAAWPTPPGEPTARVGIQRAVPGPGGGQITVRWDVALDRNRVGYALYYDVAPFDFRADPMLRHTTRVVLTPGVGTAYRQGIGPDSFANEATVSGLKSGQTYQLVIRAFDDSPGRNEETNTVVLTATAR